jgi:hypothetical protein
LERADVFGRKKRKAEEEASSPKPPPKQRGPARQTRLTRLVGLALCLAGFAAMGVGWAGAAGKDCVDCQIPYLISGGAVGLGLVGFGVGMMVMAQLRTEGRRLADRIEEWRSSAPSAGPPTRVASVQPAVAVEPSTPDGPPTGQQEEVRAP